MSERHTEERIPQSSRAMKRRGILVAAGAVVAGIVAKQTTVPVAAATYNLQGDTGLTFNNLANDRTLIFANGPFPASTPVLDVELTRSLSTLGVDLAVGVKGASNQDAGVWGVTAATGKPGVYGTSTASGTNIGVQGEAGGTGGMGVYGHAAGGSGVQGTSTTSSGVVGLSTSGYGVVGYTTGGSASLAGISTNINIPAFAGGNNVVGGIAASFTGLVYINGRLVVTDPSYKSGLLKHPDGSHRLVYCVESPESWIEDFGKATLTNGRAEVKLDPDFGATVQTDDYAVFLTPYGAMGALRVATQRPDGFVVEEIGGGSSGAFRYRVVARPKTDKKMERLAKFTPPDVKLPDVASLPKPVDPPVTPALPKKP